MADDVAIRVGVDASPGEAAFKKLQDAGVDTWSRIGEAADKSARTALAAYARLTAGLDPATNAANQLAKGNQILNAVLEKNPQYAGEVARFADLLRAKYSGFGGTIIETSGKIESF